MVCRPIPEYSSVPESFTFCVSNHEQSAAYYLRHGLHCRLDHERREEFAYFFIECLAAGTECIAASRYVDVTVARERDDQGRVADEVAYDLRV